MFCFGGRYQYSSFAVLDSRMCFFWHCCLSIYDSFEYSFNLSRTVLMVVTAESVQCSITSRDLYFVKCFYYFLYSIMHLFYERYLN